MSLAGMGSDGVARSPPTEVVLDHRSVDTNADARHDRRGKNGTIIRHVNGGRGTTTTTTGPRRQILTEEEYQSALDRIISRDYYPSVPSLRRDAAVLDARARGDVACAVAVRRAARRLERHEEVAEAEVLEERKRGRALGECEHEEGQPVTITGAGMGLDEFHRLATSEDNAEFEEVQREEVRERREVFERVFGVDPGGDRRLALTDGSSEGGQGQKGKGSAGQLLLKGVSGEGAGGSNATPLASDDFDLPQPRIEAAGAKEMPRNSLFFTPQLLPKAASKHSHKPCLSSKAPTEVGGGDSGETSCGRERIASEEEDTRLLMPPPAPVTRQSQSQSHSQPQPRPLTSLALQQQEETKERFIQPSETRFPYQSESRLPPNSSSSKRRDRGGGGGSSLPPASSDTDTDLDAPTPLSVPPSARSSGREHEGDSYVAMTPLIVPGSGGGGGGAGDPNASPIVTWGNVAGTPLVLGGEAGSVAGAAVMDGVDGDQQHTPSFSLPAEDGREAAARVAEASIAGAASSGRSKRGGQKDLEKRRRAPLFPSASSAASVADRAASLTPAARSLLDRSAGGRRGVGTTPLLGSSSTPSGKGKGTKGKVDARMGSALRSALRGSYSATPRLGVGRSSSSSSVAAAARTPRSTPLRRRRDGDAFAAQPPPSSSSSKRSRTASGGSSGRRVDGVAGHITDGLLRLDG